MWGVTVPAGRGSAVGRIFVQLMHTGRVGHPANLPPGGRPVGASAVAAAGTMWTDSAGPQPHPVPAEMSQDDIAEAAEAFAHAARCAIDAGFQPLSTSSTDDSGPV